jgi:hypothetical protein
VTLRIDRNLVAGLLVGLVLGVGGTLLLDGGDSDSSEATTSTVAAAPTESTPTDVTSTTASGGGKSAVSGGIALTVRGAHASPTITYEGGTDSDVTPNGEAKTVKAPQGGRYIYVDTTITNNTSKGIDLTCSGPVEAKVADDEGREFDADQNLYLIAGNPGCNALTQPGFDAKMTWVFLVPPDAKVVSFKFADTTDFAHPSAPASVPLPST